MSSNWRSERLGDVCDLIARGIAPVYVDDGGVRVVNQKCVRDHAIDYSLARRHDGAAKIVSSERLIRLGDVLVNSTGTGTLGRVAQVRVSPQEPTTVDTHVTIVRPKAELFHPDFFGYVMTTIEAALTAAGEGASGQTELPRAKLESDFEVRFPESLTEQQRIVATLDEAFEGIAHAAASTERNVLNAKHLFCAARAALFSSRDSSWTSEPIATICENLDGRRRPVTKRDRVPGEVPYYGASGVVDYVQNHLFDEDLLLVSEDGANLLARTYPIAFSISGPSWVNNHAHALRFADKRTQKFVEYYLNSIDLEPHVTGMAQPKLNQGALNRIPVPLPPPHRQAEIVSSLEQLHLEAQGLLKVLDRKLDALAELKQSLLARAFSGELTREPIAA